MNSKWVATERTFSEYVDLAKGTIDRAIFSDPDIYRLELERIFARSWLFMCHETMIPDEGDFFQTYMGEDRVIVTRAPDGSINVLLNTCMHRGNTVCKAEQGRASSFMCSYHGWTYDLTGKLVGVPGAKDIYYDEFDSSEWGLRAAAQIENYRGFVFATLDPEAPPLAEYLGTGGIFMIDQLADKGDLTVIPGVIKSLLPCNWKMAMENNQDYYHPGITHASALLAFEEQGANIVNEVDVNAEPSAIQIGDFSRDPVGHAILAEYGHVMDVFPYQHASLFPNVGMFTGTYQMLFVRHPKGPEKTEVWFFNFVNKDASKEEQEAWRVRNVRFLGPAGLIEQEDAENWELSTSATVTSAMRRIPLNYQMGLGHGEVVHNADVAMPVLEAHVTNEDYMRWVHRSWTEWMDAESWQALKENHSRIEMR